MQSNSKIHVIRLKPHEDLKKSVQLWAKENQIRAAVIVTCVGSLEQVHLRYANQPGGKASKGFFEILTLSGTLSASSVHLHLTIADDKGLVTGGHLLDENLIYTTAEIAIAELTDVAFLREEDLTYGYRELKIQGQKD